MSPAIPRSAAPGGMAPPGGSSVSHNAPSTRRSYPLRAPDRGWPSLVPMFMGLLPVPGCTLPVAGCPCQLPAASEGDGDVARDAARTPPRQ